MRKPMIIQTVRVLYLLLVAGVIPTTLLSQQPLGNVASMDQNHIITTTFSQPFTSLPSNPTTAQAMREITYFDGLGRPMQQIAVKASGGVGYKDLVAPITYDGLGRNTMDYLPYATATGAGGSFKLSATTQQTTYYSSTPPAGQAANSHPFGRRVLEASPLDRVLEQGFPGAVWQPATSRTSAAGRTVAYDRQVNNTIAYSNTSATRQASRYEVSLNAQGVPTLTLNGVYGNGELYVEVVYDENWSGGNSRLHSTETYTDKQERIILTRTFREHPASSALELVSTYYVYNQLGQLSFVLGPETAPDRTGTVPPTSTLLQAYAFSYRYDQRGRVVEKRVPASGIEYFVYNPLDQLVLTQDAVQRSKASPEWTYHKYDVHGRQVITGRYTSSSDRVTLQAAVNASSPLWESRHPTNPSGYTNTAFPTGNGAEVYTYTYYDHYDIPGLPPAYVASGYSSLTQGMPTAKRVKVLGSAEVYLWSVLYYNDMGDLLREYRQHYLGAGTVSSSDYDEYTHSYTLNGLLTSTTRKHYTGSTAPVLQYTGLTEYVYDHRERLLDTWHTINPTSGISTLLSRQVYNELGQLRENNIGSQSSGSSFSQRVTYSYHHRGWLASAISSQGLFNQHLYYNSGSAPQYNGNISSQQFTRKNTAGTSVTDTYSYTYDAMDRLLKGEMGSGKGKEEIQYDRMGNIQSLQRTGTGSTLVDNLSYTYHQGRLQSVHDAVSVPHSEYHLPGTAAYTYDANGNMLSRTNPTHSADNLSAVSYNYLDFPNSITTTTGTTTYTYDAQGRKLQSSQAIGSQNREYIDGIEYVDGVMELIHLPGSRIVRDGSSYSYQYFLRDHLGNNRVSLLQGSEVTLPEFSADYYPFGLRYQGIVIDGTSPENHYLYNNKEWQDQIRMYDYGARLYDPVIGRWNVVDPMAELDRAWSPYNYTRNNPIRFIDPDGMRPRRTDPPGWFQNAYNAWTRLVTGTSGSSANNAIPNASPQTQSINRALGTASDVKDIAAAAGPYALEASAFVGEGLQVAGTATMVAGYGLAPVTGGASLGLVPVGTAIELVGTGLQVPEMIASGDHGRLAYTAGSVILFGGVGTVIKKAESVGKITKTDAGILNFINDAWNKTADFIFNHTTKLKEDEENQYQNR